MTGATLAAAQAAAERCIMCGAGGEHPSARPKGFTTKLAEMAPGDYGNLPGIGYQHGFAFDPALEALFHEGRTVTAPHPAHLLYKIHHYE